MIPAQVMAGIFADKFKIEIRSDSVILPRKDPNGLSYTYRLTKR
jgi:hypothetical protein